MNYSMSGSLRFCLLFTACSQLHVQAQPGHLDPTFGTGGILIQDLEGTADMAYGICLQPDGKILVCGNYGPAGDCQVGVTRYHPDGTFDVDFANNGVFFWDQTGADEAYGLLVRPDGRIVVSGSFHTPGGGAELMPSLLQLQPNGELDMSFGVDGMTILPGPWEIGYFVSMILLEDGSILAAGGASEGSHLYGILAKVTATGQMNMDFGNSGVALADIAPRRFAVYSLSLTGTGEIRIGGNNYSDVDGGVAVAAFDSNGNTLQGYGQNGVFQYTGPFLPADGNHADLADGRSILSTLNEDGVPLIIRLTPAGELDNSFGTGGVLPVQMGVSGTFAWPRIAAASNGMMLLSGFYYGDGINDLFVSRLFPDGLLDPGFAEQGLLSVDIMPNERPTNMLIQPDESVLILGCRNYISTSTNSFILRLQGGSIGMPEDSEAFGHLRCSYISPGLLTIDGLSEFDNSPVEICITDAMGRAVTRSQVHTGGQPVPVLYELDQRLKSGWYTLSAKHTHGQVTSCHFVAP